MTDLEAALDERAPINGWGVEDTRWEEVFEVVPYINDHPKMGQAHPWMERHGGMVLRFKCCGIRFHVAIWYDRKQKRLFPLYPAEMSKKKQYFDILTIESHAQRESLTKWICDVWEKAVLGAKAAGKPGCVPWQPKNTGRMIFHAVRPDGTLCPNGRGFLPWEVGDGPREDRRRQLGLETSSGGVVGGTGQGEPDDGGAAGPEEVGAADPADFASRFE